MKLLRTALIATAATAAMGLATPALAQATRTWISGVGDDVNPCSRTAPCKTLAGAISKTATNGEINVLDPGGFGGLTITKSITIDGLGPMASVLAVGQNGFLVNGANVVVTIRNITINCAGSTIGNGIRIVNAAVVNIDNVVFENCAGTGTNGRGVAIETAADVRVTIQNSRFVNLTNFGIHSNPSAGTVTLNVDNSTLIRGGTTGIQLRQNTNATINNVRIVQHGSTAAAVTAELGTVNAHISNSVFTDNGHGVFAGNGGAPVVRLSNTVITRSISSAIQLNGGTVISYGNNPIRGNTGNEAPSSVELPR
ncbi:MAG TPA: right-handed parallel beta-helix repeat-containing protein [Allosphingosinicella sp.]|jgi:hypothetical protein